MGKLLDEAAFLELGKELKEGAAGGFSNLEGAGEVFEGDGAVSKFKKTEDVIGTQMRRPRHVQDPFPGSEGV